MASDVTCCDTKFWLYLLVIIGLVCFAGMMAGLTLGLMSLGLVDLEVLMKSGRPQDRLHAGTFYSFSHLKFQSSYDFASSSSQLNFKTKMEQNSEFNPLLV